MIIILRYAKRSSLATRKKIEIGMLIFLILLTLAWQIFYISQGRWTADSSLPLHLCSITRIVAVILLFRFNQLWFEFCALIGIGGVLQSLMTPAITESYNVITHIEYFLSHGFILFTVLYLFYVQGRRLTKYAWLKAYIFGLGIMAIVGLINYILSSNYWYICIKPGANNPLLIGDWPYYISGFMAFGLINSLIFYGIFRWWASPKGSL